MGDAFSIDRVFVGNLGRYNEGDLVGAWLELPYDEGDLERWLRDSVAVDEAHEEVFIMDSDLGGPLGEVGAEIGEWGDLSLIGIASRLAADLTPREREAVRQWAETAGECDIASLCNFMLQADAIPYARLDGERFDYASQEERLAYTVLGGLDAVDELSDEVLERNFDYAAFGRRLRDEGMALGDRGYLDPMSSADVRTDLYDRDEVLGALGAEPVAPGSSPTAEHVVDGICYFDMSRSRVEDDYAVDPELCRAVAAHLGRLDAARVDALLLYSKTCFSPGDGALELANAALQVDDLDYREYGSGRDAFEKCGRGFACEVGLSREDLEAFFSMESYGRELLAAGDLVITPDERGFIDLSCDISSDLFTVDELKCRFGGDNPASDLEGLESCSCLAAGSYRRDIDGGALASHEI